MERLFSAAPECLQRHAERLVVETALAHGTPITRDFSLEVVSRRTLRGWGRGDVSRQIGSYVCVSAWSADAQGFRYDFIEWPGRSGGLRWRRLDRLVDSDGLEVCEPPFLVGLTLGSTAVQPTTDQWGELIDNLALLRRCGRDVGQV